MHKQTSILSPQLQNNSIISRIKAFFCSLEPSQLSLRDTHYEHLELLPHAIHEQFLEPMLSHIKLMHSLGVPVKITELKEDIPNEYIGRRSHYRAEQLEYREYLRIKSKLVLERHLLRHKRAESTQFDHGQAHLDNNPNSYNDSLNPQI